LKNASIFLSASAYECGSRRRGRPVRWGCRLCASRR